MKESELEKKLAPYLKRYFKKFRWQVPLHNKVIDFVGIDKNDKLINIEFKIHNWKRVLKQATNNMNAFHYSYVCMPVKESIKEKIEQTARKMHVGVIFYSEEKARNLEIIEAPENKMIWSPNQSFIRKYIEKD
ncbi:MAG: hypothetical protein ACLFSQ_04230 [Candidatus Zixiibacteriota bacterium]